MIPGTDLLSWMVAQSSICQCFIFKELFYFLKLPYLLE
uniref:Uncharacterized protein n=1 Tax=Arundo donax TaxID=35708 RepID=A0A0A9FN66_ARUDO